MHGVSDERLAWNAALRSSHPISSTTFDVCGDCGPFPSSLGHNRFTKYREECASELEEMFYPSLWLVLI